MHGRWTFIGLLIWTNLGLSACSILQRDPRSGYGEEYDSRSSSVQDYYVEKIKYEQDLAREELGWSISRALTDEDRAVLENRVQLRRLESRLNSNREKKQYYQFKPNFRSDQERMVFLSLPTVDARERWARNRGLTTDSDTYSNQIADMIEKNDVSLGMSQRAVNESWGDPDVVEVAGDPVYGNERWLYSRYVSSSDGYQKQVRVVYFESGRVVGWETY